VGQAVEEWGESSEPLVILSSVVNLPDTQKTLSAFLTGAVCHGRTWKTPSGSEVTLSTYEDTPKAPPFQLSVCNGGETLTPSERAGLKKWRNAAQ